MVASLAMTAQPLQRSPVGHHYANSRIRLGSFFDNNTSKTIVFTGTMAGTGNLTLNSAKRRRRTTDPKCRRHPRSDGDLQRQQYAYRGTLIMPGF